MSIGLSTDLLLHAYIPVLSGTNYRKTESIVQPHLRRPSRRSKIIVRVRLGQIDCADRKKGSVNNKN